ATPEALAVPAHHLALDLERRAGGEQRSGDPADLGVVVAVDPDGGARFARHRADVPAEDLLPARVHLDEAAVAREGDADRGALEDRGVLEPGPLAVGDVARVDDHVVAAVHGEARRRDDDLGGSARALPQRRRHLVDATALFHRRAQAIAVANVAPQAELGRGLADDFVG